MIEKVMHIFAMDILDTQKDWCYTKANLIFKEHRTVEGVITQFALPGFLFPLRSSLYQKGDSYHLLTMGGDTGLPFGNRDTTKDGARRLGSREIKKLPMERCDPILASTTHLRLKTKATSSSSVTPTNRENSMKNLSCSLLVLPSLYIQTFLIPIEARKGWVMP